jgi:selenide,water dikinase
LAQVLRRLDNLGPTTHPDLLVGIDGSDDAGVYRLSDSVALVQTVDFFTPIVDEAADWGRIAVANALSDVYAMGGHPLTALQLVGWPRDVLPFDLLGDVLEGAAEILELAGVTLVGGHSIDDPEPKFGLAVTGVIHPDEILTNTGGQPGDVLVLTKPIGTGLIATAIKRGVCDQEMRDMAVALMIELNDVASTAGRTAGATAMTDVTGYGLLGHLSEMLSEIGAVIDADDVPLIPGAEALAGDGIIPGIIPGGSKRNLAHARTFTDFGNTSDTMATLLTDAQTSGGLLVAIPPGEADALLAQLPAARRIGRLVSEHPGEVEVA